MLRRSSLCVALFGGALVLAAPAAAERSSGAREPGARHASDKTRSTPSRATTRTRAGAELTPGQASRLMEQVARREARFHRPGVGYDAQTGLTYDGHPIDRLTGELSGGPHIWSAASKESLHLSLLVKALQGDRTAQLIVSPDGDPAHARPLALDLLRRKIDSYAAFNRAHPGYGGFLPWYRVEAGGKVEPTPDWQDRVPGLDNGQLAWSIYHASRALKDLGQDDLAARYASHLELMKKNVVRIFYDPDAHKMRAETKIGAGNKVPVEKQTYTNNAANYFLDDPYEGVLLCHFADLLGDWSKNPAGRGEIWKTPRRVPATFETKQGERLTVVRGYWFSAHEDWAYMVLPFRDLPVVRDLYANAQKVRTIDARERHLPGLKASTHAPTEEKPLRYFSALGVQAVAGQKVARANILAPYAAFPLALVDRTAFASWLGRMLSTPRMWGPNGIGESFRARSSKIAPKLTWDGKMLPMMAWMGGISDDLRTYLRRDGLYQGFLGRVEHDFSAFAGKPIEGRELRIPPPPGTRKGGLSALAASL